MGKCGLFIIYVLFFGSTVFDGLFHFDARPLVD